MRMRVLLVVPKNNYPAPQPQIDVLGQGLPYLAGALKRAGHQVFAVNINHQWCQPSARGILRDALQEAVLEYQPQLIGLGGLSADYSFVRDALDLARQAAPHTPIVCGGGLITYDADFVFNLLRPDFALAGDAEESLVALTSQLECGGDVNLIPNLLYWKNGLLQKTRVEFSKTSLDDLAWPDYEPFDFETYLTGLNQADHFFAHTQPKCRLLPISLGRSCPFKCTFCCHAAGPQYRPRSIDSAVAEIRHFYEQYHFNLLFIYDELFALKPERLQDFCSKIRDLRQREGIQFDWTCALRVNNVEASILREMKAAGCIFIGYGLESASPRVLHSMKKGTTPEQIRRAIRLTSDAGIGVQGSFIFGDIAETAETIKETMLFFDQSCRESIVSLGYLTPYPGSEIFDYCVQHKLIQDKKAYYEQTGCVGKYRLNMTQMPAADFFKRLDRLANLTAPGVRECPGLKSAQAVAARPLGVFPFDVSAGAPAADQRIVYEIQAVCPLCLSNVQYQLPVTPEALTGPATVKVYCSQCHRRFIIGIPLAQKTTAQPKPRLRDSLELRRYAHCLAKGQPYFGTHMGALQGQPIRHAYMDLLVQRECGSRTHRPLHLLEIGSWAGGSAITWANALKRHHPESGLVFCVDPWKTYFAARGISQLIGSQARHYSEMEQALARDEIFGLFLHNIRSAKVEDLIVTVRGSSEQVLTAFAPRRFDLIFVDGNHSYASVLADLRLAADLLVEGAILCGDDLELQASEIELSRARQMAEVDFVLDVATQEYYHPGVTLAVGEFFGCPVSCQEGFWYMRKTSEGWAPIDLPTLSADCIPLPKHFEVQEDFAFQPKLVKQSCHGYNIVHYGERFIAVHLSLGPLDITSFTEETLDQLQETRKCVIRESLQEVVDSLGGQVSAGVPRLVKENFHGFNCVEFGDKVYALALTLGPIDLPCVTSETLQSWRASGQVVVASSLSELLQELDGGNGKLVSPDRSGETYRNYNLVEHQSLSYAIPAKIGRVNLAHPAERNLPEILSSRRRSDLKPAIDGALQPHAPRLQARLCERDYAGFNLYALDGIFVAHKVSKGELDLDRVRLRKQDGVLAAETLEKLKRRVATSQGGFPPLGNQRALVVAAENAQQTKEILQRFGCGNATVLAAAPQQAPEDWPSVLGHPSAPDVAARLRSGRYELVIVPYQARLGTVAWESLLAPFCRRLLAVFPEGEPRLYEGDHFNRVLYNMAYLRSMYSKVPPVAGQQVLEIGCSDGLPCDLVAREHPEAVVGVDMLETVGLFYQNSRTTFHKLDAASLPFADDSFHLVYSIATFEHISDPLLALREMKRVLRRGGYGYVQAAPLYYSPFGHHMFGYFDDYPWIHVRLSKTEIAEYARTHGVAERIEADRGCTTEQYIEAMINLRHVNGKLPNEYGIQVFAKDPEVEILNYAPSYEGKHLLNEQILAETKPVRPEDLVAHGFELVFRVK